MDMNVVIPILVVLVVAGLFFWKKSKGASNDAPSDGFTGGGGKPSDTNNTQLK